MQQNCDQHSRPLNFGVNYVILNSRLVFLKCFAYTDIKFRFITVYFHYLTQNKHSIKFSWMKEISHVYTWK